MVEDDPDINEALEFMLTANGFEVISCESGAAMLAALRPDARASILIEVTPLSTNEAKTIANNPAAAVMMRADLCSPVATGSIFERPASCSSLILESRNNS